MNKITGFTLIEVMVALSIIAIALASLIKASGNHTHSAAYLKNKTLAHYVAVNEINLLQINNAWPATGTKHKSTEMANYEWYWTSEITKNKEDTIRKVSYTIYLDEDREEQIARVTSSLANPNISLSNLNLAN